MSSYENRPHFPPGSRGRRSNPSPISSSSHGQTSPEASPELYVEMPLTPSSTRSSTSSSRFSGRSRHSSPGSPSAMSKVAVHLTLASVKHADPGERPFVWNVTQHPDYIRGPKVYGPTLASPYTIPPEIRKQPALTPPQNEITISYRGLPWAINIVAPVGEVVTVELTLTEIYKSLHVTVHEHELDNLYQAYPGLKEKAGKAFRARIASLPANKREEERRRGFKRVDLLADNVQFAGLSPEAEEDSLSIHFAPFTS